MVSLRPHFGDGEARHSQYIGRHLLLTGKGQREKNKISEKPPPNSIIDKAAAPTGGERNHK